MFLENITKRGTRLLLLALCTLTIHCMARKSVIDRLDQAMTKSAANRRRLSFGCFPFWGKSADEREQIWEDKFGGSNLLIGGTVVEKTKPNGDFTKWKRTIFLSKHGDFVYYKTKYSSDQIKSAKPQSAHKFASIDNISDVVQDGFDEHQKELYTVSFTSEYENHERREWKLRGTNQIRRCKRMLEKCAFHLKNPSIVRLKPQTGRWLELLNETGNDFSIEKASVLMTEHIGTTNSGQVLRNLSGYTKVKTIILGLSIEYLNTIDSLRIDHFDLENKNKFESPNWIAICEHAIEIIHELKESAHTFPDLAYICDDTQSALHAFKKAETFTSGHKKPEKVPGCIIFYWLIRDFVSAQFTENWEETSKYATRIFVLLNRAVDPNPRGGDKPTLNWPGLSDKDKRDPSLAAIYAQLCDEMKAYLRLPDFSPDFGIPNTMSYCEKCKASLST